MTTGCADPSLQIFSTCPPSNRAPRGDYLSHVKEIARWSEDAGCEGILVYTDNSLVDPWLVSQAIIEATERLCPLVAVQPAYMHPYTAAKITASFAFLYGRRLWLNMVAGGFRNDLLALNDRAPHDARYARLVEYTTIIQRLLESPDPVTFEGHYYRVDNLRMTPPVPPELMPGIFVSGSSEAGMNAARQLGATAIEYPRPAGEYAPAGHRNGTAHGIRIGIIARPGEREAWIAARTRFPEDRKGQITHQLAMKVSDSSWHHQLSELGEDRSDENPYWLVPFQNYKTFCPYLVGSYERVADEVGRYVDAGYRTFILDVPASPAEMRHIGAMFEQVECGFAVG